VAAGTFKIIAYEGGSRSELRPQLAWRRDSPPKLAGNRFLEFLQEELEP
jgi:hypothetical protein